jgi:hypothetical protein
MYFGKRKHIDKLGQMLLSGAFCLATTVWLANPAEAQVASSQSQTVTLGSAKAFSADSAGSYTGGTGQYNLGTSNTGTITSASGSTYFSVAAYNPYTTNFSALTSITVTLKGGVSTTFTPTGTFKVVGAGGPFSIYDSMNLAVFAPVTSTLTASSTQVAGLSTATSNTKTNLITNTTSSATYASGFSAATNSVTSGMNLYSITGGGTIYFDLAGIAKDTITGGTTKTDDSTWSTNATLTITYNYILVPEPGTWSMMAGCAVAGGLALRRRRRRAVSITA